MGAIGKDSAHVSGVVRKDVAEAMERYRKLRKWTKSELLQHLTSAWTEGRAELDEVDAIFRGKAGLPPVEVPYEGDVLPGTDAPRKAPGQRPKRSRKEQSA